MSHAPARDNNLAVTIILLSLLTLTGCSSTSRHPDPGGLQFKHLPPQAELSWVPFFPQQEHQCGPAALAAMITAQGRITTARQLTREVYIPRRKGSLQIEMIAAARSRGLINYRIKPDLQSLLAEVSTGNPVLVLQNLGLGWMPQWHYAVAVGYDLADRSIILRSGKRPRHRMPIATFDNTWQRSDRWAMVILAPDRMAATAVARPWLEAIHALEQSGRIEPALTAYRLAANRWPEDPLVLMTRANAEQTAGNHKISGGIFRQLIRQQPGNATVWNNLAYVLAAQDCAFEARSAIQCALILSPEDQNIQASALELKSSKLRQTGRCPDLDQCPVAINR